MARKTNTKTAPKAATKKATNPQPKRAIDDNFVAPKRKPKAEPTITFAEALAEHAAKTGKTVEEVKAELTSAAQWLEAGMPKPERQPGTSNLASTIRSHRANYQIALHPNGKKTQNNGDAVAQALLLVPLDELKAFSATRYGKSYDHLNPGHARMCIGNLIRGEYRKGDAAVIEWVSALMAKATAEAE